MHVPAKVTPIIEWIVSHAFDLIVILCIFVYSLSIWWPTRFLPFHWDSAGFYINAEVEMVNSHFTPLIAGYSDFAHPPLLIFISALIWQLTHGSIFYQHLVMFPFIVVLLTSTYFLGKSLINPIGGVVSMGLMAVLPVFLAEIGVIYLDMPVAALITLALIFWLHQYHKLSIVTLFLAVLVKDLVIIIFPLLFYLAYLEPKPRRRQLFIWLLLPVIGLFIYLLYHYFVTGWFLVAPQAQLTHRFVSSLTEFFHSFKVVNSELGFDHGRWLLWAPGILAAIYLYWRHRQHFKRKPGVIVQGFLAQIVLSVFFFTVIAEFAPRYALFLYPLAIISFLFCIYEVVKVLFLDRADTIFIVYTIIVIVFFIFHWYPSSTSPNQYDFRPPDDLSYLDTILIHRQLGSYLQVHESNSQIFGAFPENIYLTQPYQGYVISPLNFSLCDQFKSDQTVRQLAVIHGNSPGTLNCRLISTNNPFKLITRFESGSKWLELYQITATNSAVPNQNKNT